MTNMVDVATDEKYMRRCLQLAYNGRQNAQPNPMVGAVIVADGRIIGEGYHVRCGCGHAEVNAFASVKAKDEHLLPQATIYVSLEPCSHYGKTPPCADLIIKKGVRRVVVGCIDPFSKVAGRGIQKIKDAGISVTVGVLEHECKELNKRFITVNTLHRPYVLLKWCQTANGFLDDNYKSLCMSTSFTQMLVHKLRSEYDAIIVGRITNERDNPQLNVRYWVGNDPLRLVLDKEHPCIEGLDFSKGSNSVVRQVVENLYERGVQSLIVEGGTKTLQSFIDSGFWDEIRVETVAMTVSDGTKAPTLNRSLYLSKREVYGTSIVDTYRRYQN